MMMEELSDRVEIIGVPGIPEITPQSDLPALIFNAIDERIKLKDGDIMVITSKIVSKAENRYIKLDTVQVSRFAKNIAPIVGKDERELEMILNESTGIIKVRKGIIIVEGKHKVVCANAGIDKSNVGVDGMVLLLPRDPDASARRIKKALEGYSGRSLAVIISDTYSRPWREGQVNFAIGMSGIKPFRDYRGKTDHFGKELKVTNIAHVDELAAAAELVMGKSRKVPVVVIRNYYFEKGDDKAIKLNRPIQRDLFR